MKNILSAVVLVLSLLVVYMLFSKKEHVVEFPSFTAAWENRLKDKLHDARGMTVDDYQFYRRVLMGEDTDIE